MRCSKVQEAMASYLAGEVRAKHRKHIQAHLETCAACRIWQEEVLEMAHIWSAEDSPFSGPSIVAPVLERLKKRSGAGAVALRRLSWWDVPRYRTLAHYGVAAVTTIVLFQLGIFERLGTTLAQNSLFISNQIQNLLMLLKKI